MAKTVVVKLTDDLDGSEATETVLFGLGGTEYEIDLSAKNKTALDKALERYVAAGRKVGSKRATRSGGGSGRSDLAEIRTWARSNGYELSDRGRVAAEIIAAYDAAQK